MIEDPNSIGGLLLAMEERLTREQRKEQVDAMKRTMLDLRKLLQQQHENGIAELRVKSRNLVQELHIQLASKVEALKLELADELNHREGRRKSLIDELKGQILAIEGVLRKSAEERKKKETESDGVLKAIGQLDDLREKLNVELASREKDVQIEMVELQSGCVNKLDAIKEQISKEMSVKECKMDKELEEMKVKFQTGFNHVWNSNFCIDAIPMNNMMPSCHVANNVNANPISPPFGTSPLVPDSVFMLFNGPDSRTGIQRMSYPAGFPRTMF